ncbi:fibronectin type III domain-containing protein [Marivirga sp.]|uniref:fibronectin type III domain-containing protein n=1 Tax=Marivirga sp. TaxID=2018662 RepID=UPI002D803EFD|nr:fibronectin type III domain-containing protein [Marivirga sp.]HET8858789.1 fibronectin type III domain-containing protein [Marivirga sp.]
MKKFLLIFFSASLLLGFKSNAQLTGTSVNAVTNITHEGVTLNGEITTSGAIDVDYYFNYGTTSGSLTSQAPDPAITLAGLNGTQAVDETLSGLSAETQYFYELYAEETVDNTQTATSTEGSFWTYSDVTSTAVAGFQRQSATTTSITLEWTAQNTDITGYLIVYSAGGAAPDETDLDLGTAPASLSYANQVLIEDASTTSTTINGLTANSDYSFRIIPYNVGSDPATTNYKLTGNTTLTTYTLETVTSNAIADFGVRSKGNNNIELEWTAETTDNDGYLILWATGSSAPDPATEVELGIEPNSQPFGNNIVRTGSSSTSQDITGLSAGIEYSFVIIPYNTGIDPLTTNYNVTTNSELSAYTLADEPTTDPINPARDIPNVTEMSIIYDAVPDADGYLILYATGNTAPDATGVVDGTKSTDGSEFTDADGYQFVQSSASTNPTITGLTEATEYSFRIIAFSHSADEPTTYNYKTPGIELISAYTLADQPTSPVNNFQFDDNSTSSIAFTFGGYTFPDNGGYVLYFKTGDTPEDLTNLSNGDLPNGQIAGDNFVFETIDGATAISATGLNPGTQYSFILPIYNSDGINEETFHYRKSDAPTATHWTLQTQPSDDIANLNYESKTDGSITLSYDESTGANGYLILYRTGNNDPDGNGVTDGVVHSDAGDFGQATGFQYVDGGSTLEAEITGLNPKTEYSFRIIPYSYATDGGIPVPETYNYNTASNTKREAVFTSATLPPDPVTGFVKDSATAESLTFLLDDYTTNIPGFSDDGGFLIYYEEYVAPGIINLSTIENGVLPAVQTGLPSYVEITEAAATEVAVTGLLAATRYKFSIIPYNKDAAEDATIGYNITDKPDVDFYTLQAPADGGADVADDGTFNLAVISNSEITVNWTAVTGAAGYLVLYTKSNSELDDSFLENGVNPDNQTYPTGVGEVFYVDVDDENATTVNISGLDADTDYTFKVLPYTYLDDGGVAVDETYNYNNDTPPLRSGTTLCVDPTETVADLATSNVAVNQMDISWTNASGLNVLAVARLSTSTKTAPTDGQDYTANAAFSSGDQFGASGNYVVYEGTGTSFTLTGLDDYQEYSIDVYLFNDNGFCYENVGETIMETTLCDPAITEVNNTSITVNAFDEIALTWTIQGGGNVLILARESGSSAQAPSSNIDYNENSQFGSGQELGTGNFAVYDGNGTSTSITGLDENTAYSFDIYEYNPTRGGFCYNTTAVTLSETTVCEPPESEAIFNAPANVTAVSVDLSWTAVTGADRYLIVAKEGSAVDLTFNNGDNFEDGGTGDIATSSFLAAADGDGTSGNKIVYANEGTSVTITELSGSTQYYFDIYAYKSGTYCYDFGSVSIDITTDPVEASNTLTLVGAASAISSVNNDNDDLANFITVMDFDMNDVGDDGADTKISGFTFTAGTGNDFASWNDILADAKVINTNNSTEFPATISVGSNQIEVTIGNSDNNISTHFGFLADGGSINLELQIRLKKTISEEIDLKNLVFELDPANITIRSGSEFAPVPTITTSETDNEIEVLATAFEFTTDPPGTVNAGENVSPQAVVEAKDANGNLDLDYGTFAITNAGAITMDNLPSPPSFTNGEFEFPATFNYQGSGDGTLTITDGANLFNLSSTSVTVNPTVGLTELTAGLNAGTLQSSSTDQAVLGFEIAALGTSQVNEIVFTTDEDITGLVDNLRLVASPDNIYDGDESSITSTLNITGGTTITFSGLTEDFSSDSKNYFLILDVDDNVNIDLAPVTFQLDISDIVFTNSANKNASSFSRQYDFEDVTKPEIDQITAIPTLLSGADVGNDALEIKVTFNEKMDDAIIPDIDFPTVGEDPLFTNSLSGPNGNSGWSADSTFYSFYFDLADQDELMENIDISISNAFDKYGNSLDAVNEADLFSIDTENPIADNINLDLALVNRTDDTIELTVTFNKEMNGAIDPSFTPDNSINLIENGDGVWSLGNTVYTVTFTHDLGVEENITDKIIIEDAEDVAGNIMDIAETDPFTINTTRARIDFITATNTTGIYKANDVITIEVHFDQNLTVDDALGSPELDLNSNGIAVFDNAANNILTFNYTVLATENAALLDVTGFRLEDATIKNAGLNDAILTLPADAADELSTRKEIEIDTQSPEITSTSITPNTVSRVNPTLTLIVNYNEVMDQTSTPSFLPSDANIILQSGGWSDNQTYRAEFEHDLTVEEEVANVTIEISDATDSVGNTTVTADSETFNIDTQHPRITEIVTTTADGTYGPGEQINIRVVFDEAIQQTGTAPTLTLNTGATAVFDNITGVNQDQLNFIYTIGAANSGENTLDLDVTSISTSENEVLDLINNPSVLTLPAAPNKLSDNAAIIIDTRPAEITNVTSTSLEPKYKAGESIEIVVTFDEIVTVTNTPRIALNTGDYANYTGGSGTNELTFNYTVQNSDGITLFDVVDLEYEDVNSLELNGGSIIDPASVPVDQTLPTIGSGTSLSDNTDIEIDTRDPEFTIDLDIVMVDLNDLTLTVTTNYDEAMDMTTDPSYAISQGTNLIQDNVGAWTNNTTYVETFTHNGTEEELTGITIEISGATDEVGNTAVTNTSGPFDIDTQSPEIASTSITPNTVSQVNPTFTLIINYNEVMDQLSAPGFSFSNGSNISFQSGGWTNNQTYRAEFEHDLTVEEEFDNVTIEITGATDSVGNTTVTADSETFNIDTQSPRITEIVSSTADGTYGPGEQINIKVVFDEDIQQTGTTPTLTLNTGATAAFDNITNGNELNFIYTIGAVNSGENTLDLNVTSISTSENEVLDLVDNPSVLTLPVVPNQLSDNAAIVIDTRPAVITNVTSTNVDGKYKAGDNIEIVVTFDEVVTVTNTPRIALNTGDYAEYTSGSNSTELIFNYTVQDSDGVTLFDVTDLEYNDINSLELNGGSIIDPASVPVDQTLPTIGSSNSLGDNKNIEIDTRSPEFTIDLDISMVDLNDLVLTVTTVYDEDMDMSSDPAYSFNLPNNLDKDNVGNWSDNRTYVETFTHDQTEEEISNITIEITGATDEVGNIATTNTSASFDIDTQKPRITVITSTSSGIYGPGDIIDIKVVFDEDVQKIGANPTLNLNSTGVATYVDITNGNEMNFSYTVGSVNSGENTGDLTVNSFSPSENVVLDLQANPSILNLPGGNNLGDNANIIIDTDPADVTNVTANPTSGIFKAGDVIDIIVTFNETVVVDETGGTPRLLLNTGSYANYSSGSNSTELTFTYTVASAGGSIVDVLDLEYANINSLELNGGSIVDLASVNANLVLPATAGAGSLSDNTDIEIDTTSPTVTIDLDNTEITRANNQLVLTATYNEDMDQVTTPSLNVQGSDDLILDAANWNSATVFIATYTHNLTEEEVQNVTIEVSGATDVVGNTSITNTSETFTIDTQKPRITEIVSTSSNGLYSPGDNINIQLVFDEDVTVGGTPTLNLNSGGQANYQNVTNGNEVNFVYTVGGVNSGENTLDLDVTAFNMNGGNIRDLVSNDAEIILPSDPDRLQDNADIQVDSDPADVLNVTAVPDQGFFTAGDQIDITIEFDEPVVVTGTPLLSLNTGSNAEYVSGSNSTILTFNYTVEASNGTTIVDVAELEYVDINSIDLNSGAIEDLAGISASLGLPAVGSANSLNGNTEITIDTEDPELANDPFTPFNGEFNVSHSLTFKIEMNEPVSGQGTNNITIIDKKTSSVLVVLDGGTAFTNNTSNILDFDSFENLLQDSTEYYIQIDPGALVDRAGNPFAGFNADNIWSFTTFGPPRIDDFPIDGACVGGQFIIKGQYFTGVTRIRTNIDGAEGTVLNTADFVIVDDETITFDVPEGTIPGRITLDKQSGQKGNTADASTTSDEEISVGPSSAQLVLEQASSSICDFDDLGNVNQVEISVNVVGGSGVYTLEYKVGSDDPVIRPGYVSGTTFFVTPPDDGENTITIVSLEDEELNICTVPSANLGTDLEITKFIRSKVDAGGFAENEDEIGVIELCGANTNIVDFEDENLVSNRPSIIGDVEQGTWTIDQGPSTNGGGFSPDFNLKSVQTDRPDTVKYYASFADGVSGEIQLKLTSDEPGGLNPCDGPSDLVIIRFSESLTVNTSSNVSICIDTDENGNELAVTQLNSTVSGGIESDSLTVLWERIDNTANELANYDGTWGFKDDENQTEYSLTSNVLNPIYKASPQEIDSGRANLTIQPVVLFDGVGCGDIPAPRPVTLNINDIPVLSRSDFSEIVCSGEQEVRYRMIPNDANNTFNWYFVGEDATDADDGNKFEGEVDNRNLVFINFREVETETTEILVVEEIDASSGCVSEPDTFFISLKPKPIAIIDYEESTTISNTADPILLRGLGGPDTTNLKDNSTILGQENFEFFGPGVVQNSDSSYYLDSRQLALTVLADPNDVHEIFFRYTNQFGCVADTSISFNVFNAERIFPDLDQVQYCQLNDSIQIRVDDAIIEGFEVTDINGPGISNLEYIIDVVDGDSIRALTAIFNPATAYAENQDAENPSLISISYSTVDLSNPENVQENVADQTVRVNPLPELEIEGFENFEDEGFEFSLCSFDEPLELEPIVSGTNTNIFNFELLNSEVGLPDSLLIGDNVEGFVFNQTLLQDYLANENKDSIKIEIEYTYTNQNGCTNSKVYDFVVWKQPDAPTLKSSDICVIEDGEVEDAEVIGYNGSNENEELIWLANDVFTTEQDAILGRGTTFSPGEDLFVNSNTRRFYVFRLNENSSGEDYPSCVSSPTVVTYRRIINPDFRWNKSTFGNEDIIFTGNPNQTALKSTEWTITRISDNTELGPEAFTVENDTTVAVDFNNYGAGRYEVEFSILTRNGCLANVSEKIVILPEANLANRYVYSFDGSSEGWVSDGFARNDTDSVRLWDFSVPRDTSTFESSDEVWITNASGSYESNIESYVYSPAMDIRTIERPVVSFDLWLDIAAGNDGLILEYSTDGKRIEDSEKRWVVLGDVSGAISSGLEWYNLEDIESRPGTTFIDNNGDIISNNSSANGWSLLNDSESIEPVNAKHALEEIPIDQRENVIFRFQFKSRASDGGDNFNNPDGAAFDNFVIESLNRNVLVEYFGDDNSPHDTVEMNSIKQTFETFGNFAWINYRINEDDALYQRNSSSMLSRLYFYDAYTANNQFAIDGVLNSEFSFSENNTGRNAVSRARLRSSSANLDISVNSASENELTIDVDYDILEELPETTRLFVAVLHNEVNIEGQMSSYYNVLRTLLPTNEGSALETSAGEGTLSTTFIAQKEEDEEAITIVAFLQDMENGTIIQSAYEVEVPLLTLPTVTSNTHRLDNLNIQLYPNPAYDYLKISYGAILGERLKAKVIDVTGKEIHSFDLLVGEAEHEIDTRDLKTGLYNLIIFGENGENRTMKFVVSD